MSITRARAKDTYTLGKDKTTHTVQPACGMRAGFWVCLSHEAPLSLPGAKDAHIHEAGEHVMAWQCPEHGIEEAPGPSAVTPPIEAAPEPPAPKAKVRKARKR